MDNYCTLRRSGAGREPTFTHLLLSEGLTERVQYRSDEILEESSFASVDISFHWHAGVGVSCLDARRQLICDIEACAIVDLLSSLVHQPVRRDMNDLSSDFWRCTRIER